MDKTAPRFNLFDPLRLLAATMVIYSHSYPLLGIRNPPELIGWLFRFTDAGQLGVLIFFSISGYLNARSVTRASAPHFYFNRALRIFPGLFVALAVSAICIGPLCSTLAARPYFENSQTWLYIFHNILLSMDYSLPGVFGDNIYKSAVNGSLWTLPTEFALYLLLPLVVKVSSSRLKASLLFAGLFFVLYEISSYAMSLPINTYGLGPPQNICENGFVFFAAASIAYSESQHTSKLELVFLSGLLLLTMRTFYAPLAFMILVPVLAIKFGSIKTRGAALKNDISYGMYIYAFPVQQATWHFLHASLPPLALMAVAIAVTVVLASLSWRFVEKPMLLNKNAWASMIFGGTMSEPSGVGVAADRAAAPAPTGKP